MGSYELWYHLIFSRRCTYSRVGNAVRIESDFWPRLSEPPTIPSRQHKQREREMRAAAGGRAFQLHLLCPRRPWRPPSPPSTATAPISHSTHAGCIHQRRPPRGWLLLVCPPCPQGIRPNSRSRCSPFFARGRHRHLLPCATLSSVSYP
jgi:hypothetical protein